ncbi:hypothetical protein [Sorangium sp. So ce124]|uniref:hypothetical protein n=1 Tax=Sorangium sp. So ce124 TaxID=3133280 RepID=UPI003F5F3ED0
MGRGVMVYDVEERGRLAAVVGIAPRDCQAPVLASSDAPLRVFVFPDMPRALLIHVPEEVARR